MDETERAKASTTMADGFNAAVKPKLYTKKPVTITALLYTGHNTDAVLDFIGAESSFVDRGGSIVIKTLEGDIRASIGDYIICGIQGEFYPCKPDIFKDSYDAY